MSTAPALQPTDVFSRRQSARNTQTASSFDVLARRERKGMPATNSPKMVRWIVADCPIELTYTTQDSNLPSWANAVLQSLVERWGAHPGWDTYDAKPTKPTLVVKLLNILTEVMRDESRAPIITPLSDGGVQARTAEG